MFNSSFSDKMTTLEEYVSRMKRNKSYLLRNGSSISKIEGLLRLKLSRIRDMRYYITDVDEFAIKMMISYKEKGFKSASSDDLDLETEKEKQEAQKQAEENKDLFAAMKEALGDKVVEVRLSKRLKTHPVCLTNGGEISIEMEKVLNAMPNNQKVKADKVLELMQITHFCKATKTQ